MVLIFFNCLGLACRSLLGKVKADSFTYQFEGVEVILMAVWWLFTSTFL